MSPAAAPLRAQQGPAALAALSRAVAPTLLALGLAAATTWLWQRLAPVGHQPAEQLEYAIVRGQLERAERIAAATDVVVIGDSAGLINIDPAGLSAAVDGISVEGLATLAFAGPQGHALMLDRFRARGGAPRRVLLALRALALRGGPSEAAVERMLQSPELPLAAATLDRMRDRLQTLVAPSLYLPLPGAWSDYYGGVAPLDHMLRSRHGFLHDPNKSLPRRVFPRLPPYDRNAAFEAQLPQLAAAIAAIGPERVRLLLMPEMIAFRAGHMEAVRAETIALLESRLGLDPARRLSGLPDGLPGDRFASITHLNALGRAEYNQSLAAALRRDRERFPW
ncbi:MAG: hypothetical protein SF182_22440 [Deltaproteobacteria bacterium]|nr:hypothetical protein [Deltaproteobacteria bacterium]